MNYARLSLEELEELVQQQEQHLQELTEALLNGQRAHRKMVATLTDKRQDAAIALLGKHKPRCVVFTNFAELPPRILASWERQEQEYQAKRDMMALFDSVGGKYELL